MKVKILADSINPHGQRITTFELEYWRAFHADFMTHRAFSRNASSSRAIPWVKLRKMAFDDICYPIHWGFAKKGMQMTGDGLRGKPLTVAKWLWRRGRDAAVAIGDALIWMGIHKSIPNRLIEPFTSIRVVVTATDWDNFFALRCHKAALPDIQYLAITMLRAMQESKPEELCWGEWHVPYFNPSDDEECWEHVVSPGQEDASWEHSMLAAKISSARCARTSYFGRDDKKSEFWEDVRLHDRLVGEDPKHASPTEHQAEAVEGRHANLLGFRSYRKLIPNENIEKVDREAILKKYEGKQYVL